MADPPHRPPAAPRSPRPRRQRPRRTWPQRLILGLNVVIIVSAVGMAYALSFARSKATEIPRTEFGTVLSEQPQPGEPRNFLLVGIDSAAGLPSDSPVLAGRAEGTLLTDTLMLLRLEPGTGNASVLSIPRDLWVTHAQSGQQERVNAAWALGGSSGDQNLVETVRAELDVPIHHYVAVDLAGFLGFMELLDGVTLYVEHPLRDPKAQLIINQTGCVDLTPDQALGYVRSRTLEQQVNGRWELVDSENDLGRTRRQQDFLVAAIRKAVAKGIRNPVTLSQMVDDGLDIVLTLDDRLTPADLLDIGEDFSAFRPETLRRLSLPVVPVEIDGKQVLQLERSRAQTILDVFREEDATPTSAVSVSVRNGTGAPGVATDAASGLAALGFQIAETGDAEALDHRETVIRYGAGHGGAARLLARGVAEPVQLQRIDTDSPGVELIIGAEFGGIRAELAPRAPAPAREPGDPTPDAVTTDEPTQCL